MAVRKLPADGPGWLPEYDKSVGQMFQRELQRPLWLWNAVTAGLPTQATLGANKGAIAYDVTLSAVTWFDGSAWQQGLSLTAADARYVNVSGDTMTGSLALQGSTRTISFHNGGDPQLVIESVQGTAATIYSDTLHFKNGGASTTYGSLTVNGATFTFDNASSAGIRIYDTDRSHTVRVAIGSNLTANRVFTLTTGNADRTLDISAGDVTISAAGAALIDDADAAAQRTTLGLVAGGAGDIWVEKAGDTMTGPLTLDTGQILSLLNAASSNGTRLDCPTSSDFRIRNGGDAEARWTASAVWDVQGGLRPKSYTVATVPSASGMGAGTMIYVSDETGGAVIAFSDGTNWRRVTDRAVVS